MKYFFVVVSFLSLLSCRNKKTADLFVFNARIYTVDSAFSIKEAMVIDDGKILATGTTADLKKQFDCSEQLDAGGKFIYPGFIDAHAHFVGYGNSLQRVNLVDTKSWDEVIERSSAFAKDHGGQWLLGRGWDQNDWDIKEFPTNEKLTQLFPDRAVLLTRIDGHAAIANAKAFELAGIQPGDKVDGGEIHVKDGKLTGLLVDNAVDRVTSVIPEPTRDELKIALQAAEKNCFAMGLTTIDDCGLDFEKVKMIRELQELGELKMRLYIMLSDDRKNFEYLEKTGIIETPTLHVCSFKVYGDGALGSRGACLLKPYSDQPGHYGFLLSSPAHFDSVASWISAHHFQMCTHAIGDSGNRTILNIYGKYLSKGNDNRWRIEHAQVVNEKDFQLFGEYKIIPSVQPTHATSDMYWAKDRLGNDRVKGAYAYQDLLKQNGWLPLGTDFPVEDISPFKTFFAAVVRKDASGQPANGFQMENALTREQTLRGMTYWAAKSNFEEKVKGSLEAGKFADFVILDKDLMTAPENELLSIQPLYTYLGGQQVYKK